MPLVVMEAEVAATEKSVLVSLPSLFPATAFIPAWKPMVGLAAILGTMVTGDRFLPASTFLRGCRIVWKRSATSYCRVKLSPDGCPFNALRESALSESTGAMTWQQAAPEIKTNKKAKAVFKPREFATGTPKEGPFFKMGIMDISFPGRSFG
jgi:hypothetical protein